MRMLVAEDEATSRTIIAAMLKPYGQVEFAENGEDAWTMVRGSIEREEPFDLLCLDVRMPHQSGREVLQRLRALEGTRGVRVGEGVKVIMTSTIDDKPEILDLFKQGCEYYLVKPLEVQTFRETMDKLGFVPALDS